jgi:hypothetical protein
MARYNIRLEDYSNDKNKEAQATNTKKNILCTNLVKIVIINGFKLMLSIISGGITLLGGPICGASFAIL